MRLPFLPTELASTPVSVLEMDPVLVLAWSHAGRQKTIHHLLLFPTPDFYFPFSHSRLRAFHLFYFIRRISALRSSLVFLFLQILLEICFYPFAFTKLLVSKCKDLSLNVY